MKIKCFIIICLIIIVTACSSKYNDKKIVLDKSFYNNGEYIDVISEDLNNSSYNNYVLFVYNNFCSLPIPCQNVFKEFMEKYKIDFLSINIDEYKKCKYYEKVNYAPSILIISNKEVIAYLDAESDSDLEKYQDVSKFEEWIGNYIEFKY